MTELKFKCPEKLTSADLSAIIGALGFPVAINEHTDYIISADLTNLDRQLVCRVLREYEFDPNEVYSIRFRRNEVTVVAWDRVNSTLENQMRFIVHIPVIWENEHPINYRVDRVPHGTKGT